MHASSSTSSSNITITRETIRAATTNSCSDRHLRSTRTPPLSGGSASADFSASTTERPHEGAADYLHLTGSPEQQLRGHVILAKALLAGGDRSACEDAVEAVLALLPELGFISREAIMALMVFSVDLGPQRMRELIQTSPAAHFLLPLTTALERELGHEPRVAREVDEVAQDIQQKLARLKASRMLRNGPGAD